MTTSRSPQACTPLLVDGKQAIGFPKIQISRKIKFKNLRSDENSKTAKFERLIKV